jgi:hypothetical protein
MSVMDGGFYFYFIDLVECSSAFKNITSNAAWVKTGHRENFRSSMAEGKLDFTKAPDLNNVLFLHELGSRFDFHTSDMGMVSSFFRGRFKPSQHPDYSFVLCV